MPEKAPAGGGIASAPAAVTTSPLPKPASDATAKLANAHPTCAMCTAGDFKENQPMGLCRKGPPNHTIMLVPEPQPVIQGAPAAPPFAIKGFSQWSWINRTDWCRDGFTLKPGSAT
jgi:hypothetical protein